MSDVINCNVLLVTSVVKLSDNVLRENNPVESHQSCHSHGLKRGSWDW